LLLMLMLCIRLVLQLLERLGEFFASLHEQRQAEVVKMEEAAAQVRLSFSQMPTPQSL
jgi:hypothetical protein